MEIIVLLKNPIVFGFLVGLLSLVLLFIKDKLSTYDDKHKSTNLTYIKLFFASSLPAGILAYFLYNRNINFSNQQSIPIINVPSLSSTENTPSEHCLMETMSKIIKKNKKAFTEPYPI